MFINLRHSGGYIQSIYKPVSMHFFEVTKSICFNITPLNEITQSIKIQDHLIRLNKVSEHYETSHIHLLNDAAIQKPSHNVFNPLSPLCFLLLLSLSFHHQTHILINLRNDSGKVVCPTFILGRGPHVGQSWWQHLITSSSEVGGGEVKKVTILFDYKTAIFASSSALLL